jgi:acetyl-CoA carboxylase carboxyl transferase subunit beta
MPITDWFKAREERDYTPSRPPEDHSASAKGAWAKCESCKHILYEGELEENLRVCPHCGHHFPSPAYERIAALADGGTFQETEAGITSSDPLRFECGKPYPGTLERARERSGLPEAVVTGTARIGGHPVVLGVMDFRFVGASMGSAVGEKIARAFELALEQERSIVLSVSSGGARMQEGMLSLVQMAKTSAAAARLGEAGLPYVSILTNPTMGGVTASFATLADVLIAEPGALIGFTGARVIEQNLREKLPKGFQTSEFLLEHGMIDAVVPRAELRAQVALVLDYLDDEGTTAKADPGTSGDAS